MTATAFARSNRRDRPWTRVARLALIAFAVVALATMSFALGRATVSSAGPAPKVTPAQGGPTTVFLCRMGRAC